MHITLTIITVISLLLLGRWGLQMEADSYNRNCGGSTTWEDAFWVELRVDGSCKKGGN